MPLEILPRAAPCRNVPVTFTLALMKGPSRVFEIGAAATVAVLFSPILIPVWLFFMARGYVLALAWWRKHGRFGRRFLVVYSQSPKWAGFFAEKLVPRVERQAVVVDISKVSSWKASSSLERRAHLHWAGDAEHTPVVIHFRTRLRAEPIRFFGAFQQLQRGDDSEVEAQLARVLEASAARA